MFFGKRIVASNRSVAWTAFLPRYALAAGFTDRTKVSFYTIDMFKRCLNGANPRHMALTAFVRQRRFEHLLST